MTLEIPPEWHVNKNVVASWPEANQLYNRLFTLGDIVPLKYSYNPDSILKQLDVWEDYWQKYNPRDGGIPRYGLPYTSIDGNIIDPISLDSIRVYNQLNGTRYLEEHFCHLTDVGKNIKELQPLNEMLGDQIYRSHFLRLSKGGFFPPHRDAIYNTSFRLIMPLDFKQDTTFFMYEGKPLNLENGRVYLMNTVKIHSLFSMVNHMTMLVFNVGLNERIVKDIYSNLSGM